VRLPAFLALGLLSIALGCAAGYAVFALLGSPERGEWAGAVVVVAFLAALAVQYLVWTRLARVLHLIR